MNSKNIGHLRGVGHTTPAPEPEASEDLRVPLPTLNTLAQEGKWPTRKLPKGVVASREAAIKAERVETAKVILTLEKTGIDIMNQLIRVRTILDEVKTSMPKYQILDNIKEALEIIGDE